VSILDWLFPKFCTGCGFLGEYLCPRCVALLKTKSELCFYCEKFSPSGLTHPSCIKKGPIVGNLSLFQYTGLMTKIIHSHKYQLNQLLIDRFLSEAVQPQILRIKSFLPQTNPLLVPVPLDKERTKQRGFNQSLIICKYLSGLLGLQTQDIVLKIRKTCSQAGIKNRKSRKINIKGSFVMFDNKPIIGKDVVVVDDLVTTGATITEMARVLKKAGANRIYSFALARP